MDPSSQSEKSESEGFPLIGTAAHLCVDMQELFAQDTPWRTPWLDRVLPNVVSLVETHPRDTVFTRLIPPAKPENAPGAWHAFYERWHEMTRSELDPKLLDLVEPLRRFVPPAQVVDKPFFSPFLHTHLFERLRTRHIQTLIVTGSETDMCVLAAIMSAIDLGFRVVLVQDAVCSSADETHDAVLTLFGNRFGMQVEMTDTRSVIARWVAR